MSQAPISPLRRRMIEDMTVRGFGEKTQSDYLRHVKNFTLFLGRSPDQAQPEDLRLYQVDQRKQGVQPPTMNGAVAALRFFFTKTCNRPEMARHLTLVRQPQKLPVVLTLEEVARLIEAAPGPKYKAALGVAYGAGLRVSEVANLRVSDIDSERMVIRVEQGKGKKDRNAKLSPRLMVTPRSKSTFLKISAAAPVAARSAPVSEIADKQRPISTGRSSSRMMDMTATPRRFAAIAARYRSCRRPSLTILLLCWRHVRASAQHGKESSDCSVELLARRGHQRCHRKAGGLRHDLPAARK
jgi:hypothetical protein